MEQEIKTALKKTVKIAGVTCFALGGAALIASGAALKALVEGARYAKDSVKKILEEETTEEAARVVEAEVVPAEEPEVVPAGEPEVVPAGEPEVVPAGEPREAAEESA